MFSLIVSVLFAYDLLDVIAITRIMSDEWHNLEWSEENAAVVCSFEKFVVIDQNKRSLGLHKKWVVLKRFE